MSLSYILLSIQVLSLKYSDFNQCTEPAIADQENEDSNAKHKQRYSYTIKFRQQQTTMKWFFNFLFLPSSVSTQLALFLEYKSLGPPKWPVQENFIFSALFQILGMFITKAF
jgi:hypothetical protein